MPSDSLLGGSWRRSTRRTARCRCAHRLDSTSRVDFLAFWGGERYVIEIDGPSHYCDYDGNAYKVDERAYARNLKIERSLRHDGWNVTRIARIEVRDAMADDWFETLGLLGILPFYRSDSYPEQPSASDLGLREIDCSAAAHAAFDDIPF
jgi:very-short-patch-repair endonuclease